MLSVLPIAVAGFASSWMLLWGLAAAIPILLHYLYRRRQTLVRWGAMKLLLQVIEREAKRVHFEQLLLLIVRTLVLIVLAIALSRPYWLSDDGELSGGTAEPPTNWIVAIDVSYSMGYRVDNETRLQAAQRRALEIIDATSLSDPIALISLGQPPHAVIAAPSFDHSAVIAEVERLTLNDAGCNVGNGLQLIGDIALRAQQDPAHPARVRVVILSDFGTDHWQAATRGPEAKRLQQLGEKFPIDFESLSDREANNLAVTALRPASSRVLSGRAVEIDVTVANYGDSSAQDLPVQIGIDDNTLASQRIDIPAQSTQTLHFSVVPSTLGLSVLSASIPSDRLLVDNRHLQVIEVREDYDVLFVEQQAGDARLLQLGLRPEGGSETARAKSTVSAVELSTLDLDDWQVIVLCDLERIDSVQLERLDRFVRDGGALICLWGPRTVAANWNDHPLATELLGFRLLEASAEQSWGIDPLEYRSPLVAPFVGFPDSGLLTTPIFRYWKIEPLNPKTAAAENWQVDLAIDTGDPLIVRHRASGGVVTSLFSAPQTGSSEEHPWNAMAAWPSFVPLLQRLVQTAMDHSLANHSVLAGQPLVGQRLASRVTSGAANPVASQVNGVATRSVTITKPDGSDSQLAIEDTRIGAAVPWTFSQTQQSGVYWAGLDNGSL
ncbi:MAG: BatA domain-containing protein, partial [Aureliella sp.]